MSMLSPGVYTKEIDRTLNVNNVVANATGFVGTFRWGPVEEAVRITTNESELVDRMGKPDSDTRVSFHSALNYLLYANPLYIVRAIDDASALNAAPTELNAILVKNDDDYDDAPLTDTSFIARYPGSMGNGLMISISDNTAFETWEYSNLFDYAPDAGEFNMVVVDEKGFISGNAGTVLEQYSLMSKSPGSKKPDGTSAYIKQALKNQSSWVLSGDLSVIDLDTDGLFEVSLEGGADGNKAESADFNAAWKTFNGQDLIDVIRVFTSGSPEAEVGTAIDVADSRQDMIAFVAPQLSDVYNNITAASDVKDYFETAINHNSSYAFYVDNWKMVYDKYSDEHIWIPCDSDAAALHARTFSMNEPWFSPAGLNRGQLKNVIKLAWNPNKAQRDVLYKSNVNSIVSFPGEGTVLFGDKTGLRKPSAFNRINVRTLFIVLKKNISYSARYQLFELNDAITRGVFRNMVNQYLEGIQARRGLYDFQVVSDESNNTAQVIDSNEFVGDIFLKPTRTISFIKLNFVAVSTGVDFDEVEGVS